MIDLVAGGRRDILCDQPDVIYSAAFVHVWAGARFRLRIPASDAIYTVVSLSNLKAGQATWDAVHGPAGHQSLELYLGEDSDAAATLDTGRHRGLCVLFVRPYFRAPVDRAAYAPHRPQLDLVAGPPDGRGLLPAGLMAGAAFLAPRLASLAQARIVGPRLPLHRFIAAPERRSRSEFVRSGRYLVCRWRIAGDEVLGVEYEQRGAVWSALSVSNYYLENKAHLNSHQLDPNANGTLTWNLGTIARAYKNYINTRGLNEGLLLFREVRPGADPVMPVCTVSKARDVLSGNGIDTLPIEA